MLRRVRTKCCRKLLYTAMSLQWLLQYETFIFTAVTAVAAIPVSRCPAPLDWAGDRPRLSAALALGISRLRPLPRIQPKIPRRASP
eukprot:scaffold56804_cov56-Phaeocystis_antarctica.AAC.1